MPDRVSPRVVLVGMPGAGKTTVGRRLAQRLRVRFLDADEAIEQRAGRSVRDIFATDGEPAFRTLEAATVAEVLTGFDGVFAVGGGALLDPDTQSRVRAAAAAGSAVVLLTASVPVLKRRVGDGARRPLLAGDVSGRLATLAEERRGVFESLSTLTVHTDGLTRQQVAYRISRLVGPGSPNGPGGAGR